MTGEEFDALVILMKQLAWRAAGDAINQRRAGSEEDDIEDARVVCISEEQFDEKEKVEALAKTLIDTFDNPDINYVTFERTDADNWGMRRFTDKKFAMLGIEP